MLPVTGARIDRYRLMHEETKYWVALNNATGVGPARFNELERHFGSIEQGWRASATDLQQTSLGSKAIQAILDTRERVNPDYEMERLEQAGARAVTFRDPEYPARLRTISNPPSVLYIKGDLTRLNGRTIAIVGTRKATAYGIRVTNMLATEAARAGVAIVSGLAIGIDTVAHEAALRVGGYTVAVLPGGVDVIAPKRHESVAAQIAKQGAIISEAPLGMPPMRTTYIRRNRIISGLGSGVLVVQGRDGSGATSTVEWANEQERSLFVVPGDITVPQSFLPNSLIRNGATPISSVQDLMMELNVSEWNYMLSEGTTDEKYALDSPLPDPVHDPDDRTSHDNGYSRSDNRYRQ